MRDVYSLYEAKARLSAILRMVREGRTVTVTIHGEPVAEIRPIEPAAAGVAARLDLLAERGILVRSTAAAGPLKAVAKKPGALKRFLAARD